MEGKALLAGPAVRVLDNTEVGVVGVLVVHGGDGQFPTKGAIIKSRSGKLKLLVKLKLKEKYRLFGRYLPFAHVLVG